MCIDILRNKKDIRNRKHWLVKITTVKNIKFLFHIIKKLKISK